jgi:hypothetical protein
MICNKEFVSVHIWASGYDQGEVSLDQPNLSGWFSLLLSSNKEDDLCLMEL